MPVGVHVKRCSRLSDVNFALYQAGLEGGERATVSVRRTRLRKHVSSCSADGLVSQLTGTV